MTTEDWNELLQVNLTPRASVERPERVIEYGRGDTVIQAGHKYNMFAQIIQGSCSLTRGERITYLGQGEIVGELSFLTDLSCDFTVTACEDKTSLFIINGSYINELTQTNPLLAAKFYRHLCSVLAVRVQDLNV
jgi:CRP-like cAMP-binding protein